MMGMLSSPDFPLPESIGYDRISWDSVPTRPRGDKVDRNLLSGSPSASVENGLKTWSDSERQRVRLMIFRRPAPPPQKFVENIKWWFWDGVRFSGLITFERFSELARIALDEAEHGKYVVDIMTADIAGGRTRERTKRISRYMERIDKYLDSLSDDEVRKWVDSYFESPSLDVFRAYFNILEGWGYPYRWSNIQNARGEDALLISVRGRPTLAVLQGEFRFIQGFPFRFQADAPGVTWWFERGDVLRITRTRRGVTEQWALGELPSTPNRSGDDLISR